MTRAATAIRTRFTAFAALLAIAGGAAALTFGQTARAASSACSPHCVILIEVDGLEPKDVTPQTTPVLWALGHKSGDPTTDPGVAAADQLPGMGGRNGWTWEAGRGVMQAGTAAAAASLLTGRNAANTGVPSDDYFVGGDTTKESRLGDGTIGTNDELKADTLLRVVADGEPDNKVAAVLGDPALDQLATRGFQSQGDPQLSKWEPTSGSDPGVPAYCTPPQDPNSTDPSTLPNSVCPAADADTMNNAFNTLTKSDGAAKISFAYIHLAELGAIKRLYGDTDGANAQSTQITAVADALHETDSAIGEFIAQYSQDSSVGGAKWGNTIVFVTGSHGYESTPIAQRIPNPDATTDTNTDLADFVTAVGGSGTTFIPQGSTGTIYYSGSDKSAKLKTIRDALLSQSSGPDSTQQCQATGGCIQEVLYVHDDPLADGNTVAAKHPTWNLGDSATAGDLLVVAKPGWGIGRAVPLPTTSSDAGAVAASDIGNPFNGSPGGPRNRAIFALANGPTAFVKGWSSTDDGGYYPVTTSAEDPSACPSNPTDVVPNSTVDTVNMDPGDDSGAKGHECQPQTADFAPTIAALMKVTLLDFDGRFLQEAFNEQLAFPEEPPLPPPDVPQDVAAPAVEIYIPPPPPPPPPPKGFDFYGLVRDLRAQVVDQNGCSWSQATTGTKLDFLKIEGDFGKPLEAVTLTFYKQMPAKAARASASAAHNFAFIAAASKCKSASASARAAASDPRTKLQAIATFKPFTVQRGHVVLKLKVPAQFKPSYVGITVQEAQHTQTAKSSTAQSQTPAFQAFGDKAGGVYAIADASKLHKKKGKKRR